jgi:UDP-glucose:glycoprotein glucosyltransferase
MKFNLYQCVKKIFLVIFYFSVGLGLKATFFILQSDNPLSTLQSVSQDFPMLASSIAKVAFDKKLKKEIQTIQRTLFPENTAAVWINGIEFDSESLDPFKYICVKPD